MQRIDSCKQNHTRDIIFNTDLKYQLSFPRSCNWKINMTQINVT